MENKTQKPKTLHQLKKELRQMKAPTVFKTKVSENKTILVIVYEDREETYELIRKDSFKSIKEEGEYESYDRYNAEELCRNSGGRQIHYQTKEED